MNGRQLERNKGRIPRLLWHIERAKAKKQPERVEGFQKELDRRCLEMKAAGYGHVLDEVLKINMAAA